MAKNENLKKIKSTEQDYADYRQMLAFEEYENIMNLLVNSVKIENIEKDVPEDIVKRWLFELGRVAVFEMGNNKMLWAKCNGAGVDEYGQPTMFTIITANSKTWTIGRNSDNLKGVLYIKPNRRGVFEYLWQRCQELAYVRMCMQNNLIATENQCVYECADVDTVNKMKIAFAKREIGMPVIFASGVDKSFSEGVDVLGKDVTFVADKLLGIYTNIRNEVLEHFGILAGNTDKKERVQVGEIQSQLGYVIDNIYMFIETFNKHCELNNLPYKMVLNSTVENLYADYQNETEQGEEENDKNNN